MQLVIIAMVLGGDTVRQYFTFVPRTWFAYVDQKKWIFAILTFMIGNMIQSMCSATGAFEVFVDDKLVFIFNLDMVYVTKRSSSSN